ncbi:DEKNAAC100669 [Brettanomyces naardenensis]|uniref:DEKNAAC100669 n=1 Tax=Brettanomyces naardenensis TaxID=13370 RepID=A0A448YF81_BRENA|nr:DEKNAAC100669 [Brettanomyces naardenensis]
MGGFNNVVFSRNHYLPHYAAPFRIERVTVLLKDKETRATIYPIFDAAELPDNLLLFLTQEYNDEIARGDTQPFFDPLTVEEFRDYWFGQFAAVMVLGDNPVLYESLDVKMWATKCLGTMFIKSSYPGRSAHVCTGNFLVNAGIRRKGIGTTLTECFLTWAPRLGYSYSMIELIFETNMAAKKVLERLHFTKIGRVQGCGLLRSTKDSLIDAITYGRELQLEQEEDSASKKHEHIKNYLSSGQYPESATRQEKSRLRALAYHYTLRDGKLFLKDKEVISNVAEQYRIARRIHMQAHLGINRTTSIICEHYHWPKVKETVSNVIKNCPECKDPAKSSLARSQVQSSRLRQPKMVAKSAHPQSFSSVSNGHNSRRHTPSVEAMTVDNSREGTTDSSRATVFPEIYHATETTSDYDGLGSHLGEVVPVEFVQQDVPQSQEQNKSDDKISHGHGVNGLDGLDGQPQQLQHEKQLASKATDDSLSFIPYYLSDPRM